MTKNSKEIYLWNNPDFSEVIIFYGVEATSFRDRKKAKEFLNKIRFQMQRIQCDNWPYSSPIMVAIGISGPTKLYSRRDLDNMCKVILDAGNKIIYNDDRLINILTVEKQLWESPLYGFQVGIRSLDTTKVDKYSVPTCFKSDTDNSVDKKDITAPIILRFENEADKEYAKQFG